jgi:hypothetical protein
VSDDGHGIVQGERDLFHSECKASLNSRCRATAASGKIDEKQPKWPSQRDSCLHGLAFASVV